MKYLFLTLTLLTHTAFAQLQVHTSEEEVIDQGHYKTGFLRQNGVGPCSLPMVTRGEESSLNGHYMLVDMSDHHNLLTAKRIYLEAKDQFGYSDCTGHRQDILKAISSDNGPYLVSLFYKDKIITSRGTYLRLAYCNKAKVRTIEAIINKVLYSSSIQIAVLSCKDE